jgi:hypothetical protein
MGPGELNGASLGGARWAEWGQVAWKQVVPSEVVPGQIVWGQVMHGEVVWGRPCEPLACWLVAKLGPCLPYPYCNNNVLCCLLLNILLYCVLQQVLPLAEQCTVLCTATGAASC